MVSVCGMEMEGRVGVLVKRRFWHPYPRYFCSSSAHFKRTHNRCSSSGGGTSSVIFAVWIYPPHGMILPFRLRSKWLKTDLKRTPKTGDASRAKTNHTEWVSSFAVSGPDAMFT